MALGGRSMGARAAVMAAKERREEEVRCLVLVSYPLHTGNGDVRDEILLEVEEGVKVLFVVGDRDAMCDLERMKARSWRVVVQGGIMDGDEAENGDENCGGVGGEGGR
ncbi:hypothetical protein EG329_009036 [Mollisiaceae sp. DMI_Dod_QoI]|nr:hypothetical protein EG329_009036 [Helotiales sp. DMI_Dod_QoI]